jgi:P-type conjugative transfer protein TrbJ
MKTLFAIAIVVLTALPARAQFGGSVVFDPSMFGRQAQQLAEEVIEAKAMIVNLRAGLAGGFSPDLALIGELQNFVSTAQGLPLNLTQIQSQYTQLFPGYGYGNGTYGARYEAPERTTAVTLGTMESAASQLDSLSAERARLSELAGRNSTAIGNLQTQEVGNEISLFNAEQDLKLRNAINAQLNAQAVVESNQVNDKAEQQMESRAISEPANKLGFG